MVNCPIFASRYQHLRKFGDFRGADEGKGDFKDIKGRDRDLDGDLEGFGSLSWFAWWTEIFQRTMGWFRWYRPILVDCLDDSGVNRDGDLKLKHSFISLDVLESSFPISISPICIYIYTYIITIESKFLTHFLHFSPFSCVHPPRLLAGGRLDQAAAQHGREVLRCEGPSCLCLEKNIYNIWYNIYI